MSERSCDGTSLSTSTTSLDAASEMELDVQGSGAPTLSSVSTRSRSLTKRCREDLSDAEDCAAKVAATGTSRVRGRGRPPGTGQYVGVAAARRAHKEAVKEAERNEAEAQVALAAEHYRNKLEATEPVRLSDDSADDSAEGLLKRVTDACGFIQDVGRKSKNIKGELVGTMKKATATIVDAVTDLAARTTSEETRRLRAANARLQTEVEEMRSDIKALREELRQLRTAPASEAALAAAAGLDLEELKRAIMMQTGAMVNARCEATESRLPPEPRLRPPLAADRTSFAAATGASARGRPAQRGLPPTSRAASARPAAPAARAGAAATTRIRIYARPLAAAPRPAARLPPPVVRPKGPTAAIAAPAQGAEMPAVEAATPVVPVSTAAPVVPTVAAAVPDTPPEVEGAGAAGGDEQPGPESGSPAAAERGITYAELLSAAKQKVDLAGLEITQLRFRQAATGARILEVPGAAANSAPKADALARELTNALGAMAQVARPVQTAELRLHGLDDSVTEHEVAACVVRVGECDEAAVSHGDIRRGSSGLGTVWVRCPASAARRVCAAGRLRVGWSMARVELLEARPLRCYKCLVPGHTRALCPLDVDRSEECYRCGVVGHKSATCLAAPRCTVCQAAGKPADHRGGSGSCPAPPLKGKLPTRAGPAASPSARSPSPPAAAQGATQARDGNMDVDNQ